MEIKAVGVYDDIFDYLDIVMTYGSHGFCETREDAINALGRNMLPDNKERIVNLIIKADNGEPDLSNIL